MLQCNLASSIGSRSYIVSRVCNRNKQCPGIDSFSCADISECSAVHESKCAIKCIVEKYLKFHETWQSKSSAMDTEDTNCCCHRPKGKILCKACGYILDGRVRRPCPVHPKVIFLMDKEQCPRCRAYSYLMQEFYCR